AGPEDRRRRLRGADADQGGGPGGSPGRAACTADGGARRPVVRARERRAPPDARPGGCGRHRPARRRLPRMTLAFLHLTWPTVAVAFLLQNIALLAFGPLGKSAGSLAILNAPWDVGGVFIKKIAVISVATAAGCLVILQLLLTRTPLGLHMRAASMDFRTARLLGVRANRVIGTAVIISGLLAATSAVFLRVQEDSNCSTCGLPDPIIVLPGRAA